MLLGFISLKSQIVEIPDANLKNALLTHDPTIDTNADSEIQISEAKAILYLNLEEKSIIDPTGIEAFVNLQTLNLVNNDIVNIDVTSLTKLITLALGNNEITAIDVSQNILLKTLTLNSNQLTELDVTNNPDLELIYPSYNNIAELDLTQNPNLKNITCLGTQLTELDFSNNPSLENLSISDMEMLEFLNLQNGTNSTLVNVWITGNLPALQCVQVDADVVDNIPESWVYLDEINFSANCALDVNDLAELNLKIYPNPVQDILNISSQKKIDSVQIYDVNGKLVSNSTQDKISLNHLPNGTYWVLIQIEGKTYREKLIKKN